MLDATDELINHWTGRHKPKKNKSDDAMLLCICSPIDNIWYNYSKNRKRHVREKCHNCSWVLSGYQYPSSRAFLRPRERLGTWEALTSETSASGLALLLVPDPSKTSRWLVLLKLFKNLPATKKSLCRTANTEGLVGSFDSSFYVPFLKKYYEGNTCSSRVKFVWTIYYPLDYKLNCVMFSSL